MTWSDILMAFAIVACIGASLLAWAAFVVRLAGGLCGSEIRVESDPA
jgi:hypothetical protein